MARIALGDLFVREEVRENERDCKNGLYWLRKLLHRGGLIILRIVKNTRYWTYFFTNHICLKEIKNLKMKVNQHNFSFLPFVS